MKLPLLLFALTALARAELPDISTIPNDLQAPETENAAPSAGHRVTATTAPWQGPAVHHTIYLPSNWPAGAQWPVIVEYAGNGGFQNKFGDRCDGTVEGCHLGYGLSAGRDYIWVCLPFVTTGEPAQNTIQWWGDAEQSVRYCVATVRDVCAKYGGDPKRVVLCGFSRGSIACNYIGLRTDEIASLWCGMLCHSHYDGIRKWPYSDAIGAPALERLQRLGNRPQFISHEGGTAETQAYLKSTGVAGQFTFVDFMYRNHTDTWALRDCELRQKAREWLHAVAPPNR